MTHPPPPPRLLLFPPSTLFIIGVAFGVRGDLGKGGLLNSNATRSS